MDVKIEEKRSVSHPKKGLLTGTIVVQARKVGVATPPNW